ncbi:G-patch domain-containing protein [Tanacetum coccineum]
MLKRINIITVKQFPRDYIRAVCNDMLNGIRSFHLGWRAQKFSKSSICSRSCANIFLFHVATVTKSVVQKWSDADDKDMDPTVATMTRMTGDHPTAVDKTKLLGVVTKPMEKPNLRIETQMDGEKYRHSTGPSNSRIKDYFLKIGILERLALLNMEGCKNLFNSVPISTSGLKSALELSFPLPRSLQRVLLNDCNLECTDYFPLSFSDQSFLQYINLANGSASKRLAQQRREQMKDRSVDVKKINSDLEAMVQNGDDVRSFDLTHLSDCCQLLGISNEEAGLKVDISKEDWKETSGVSPLESRSAKNKSYRESHKKNRRDEDKATTYATQAVSFILCGIMESEPGVTIIVVDESKPIDQTVGSSSYCAFKMHTTCFGLRMMAKMGYVSGNGLGKDGTGISGPIHIYYNLCLLLECVFGTKGVWLLQFHLSLMLNP